MIKWVLYSSNNRINILKDYGRMIIIMNNQIQDKVLDLWITEEETTRIIKKLNLTLQEFKTLFAVKILRYVLDVYNKKAFLGDCPVVFAMLTIFKKYNLSVTEVHHICDTFKLNITATLIETNGTQLLTPLLHILRENFKGVLKSFMDIQYGIDIGTVNIVNKANYLMVGAACTLNTDNSIAASSKTENIVIENQNIALQTSFNSSEESDYVKNYVNTSETQEEFEIIHSVITGSILDEFNDVNEMFLDTATLEETYTQKYHELLLSSIDVYISIFLDLIFFNKISTSLNELKYLIIDISIYTDDQLLIMRQLTESLMLNLIKWKEEIIDKKNKVLHYYDDAITGDIEQLKVMLFNDENVDSNTDENLDGIFDF